MIKKQISFFVLFLFTLFAFTGCVKNKPESTGPGVVTPPLNIASAGEKGVWDRYLKIANGNAPACFRLEGSLRYNDPDNKGHRVSFYIWSNGEYPYRMDAMAGFGSTVLSARESNGEFLAYTPKNEKAFSHKGWQMPRFVLPGLGLPLPLTIANLAELLEGRYANLFGLEYAHAQPASAKDFSSLDENFSGYAYSLTRGPLYGMLVLDEAGRPCLWQEEGLAGWSIEMEYEEEAVASGVASAGLVPGKPETLIKKLTIKHKKNYNAVLIVKERENPAERFTDSQLAILIPEGTEVLPVKRLD